MHRQILGLEHGDKLTGDHRETSETLNNQRSNLRIATQSQQAMNRRRHVNSASGLKGAVKKGNKYRARICTNGKFKIIGYGDTPEEGHALYAQAALEQFGEFARLA